MLPAQSVMGLAQEGAKPEPSLAAQPQEVATAQEPYVVKENDTLTDIATAHLSQGGKTPTKKEVWRQAAVWADLLNLEGKGKKLKTRGTDLKPGMKLPGVSAGLETRPGVYVDFFGAPKKPPKKTVSDAARKALSMIEDTGASPPFAVNIDPPAVRGPPSPAQIYGLEALPRGLRPLPDTSNIAPPSPGLAGAPPSRDIVPPGQVPAAPSPSFMPTEPLFCAM